MSTHPMDIGNFSDWAVIFLLVKEIFNWIKQSKFELVLKTVLDHFADRRNQKNKLSDKYIKELSGKVSELEEANSHLYKELKKSSSIDRVLDAIRDKYNFRRAYTIIFSNGTVDLAGAGIFYYSIVNECSIYHEPPIKSLYNKKSLSEISSWINQVKDVKIWDSNSYIDEDTTVKISSDIKDYMLVHSIDRLIAAPIFLNNILIGALCLEIKSYSSFPNTTMRKNSYEEALSDILLHKHTIEAIYQKYK